MRVVIFCHSLVSCWNHGNAHFLRGVCSELIARGHAVDVYEPAGGWSLTNLLAESADAPAAFRRAFPELDSTAYDPQHLDLEMALDGADLVLVHEWNDAALVGRIGRHRRSGGRYCLLFHDTHHRAVSRPDELGTVDLEDYDGVLAFGAVLQTLYQRRGWGRRVWTWHEAADTRRFWPRVREWRDGDLVWIGNWGDGERSEELQRYLLGPARALALSGTVHGVRYPKSAFDALARSGLRYAGWLPNQAVPSAFARHDVTVHVPRGPYVTSLPGIPTIRMFEALACGMPLVSAPWDDCEGLFRTGTDYLRVDDGRAMHGALRAVLDDPELAESLARHGRETVLARHTCAHRVDELLAIVGGLVAGSSGPLATLPE
jgi:spore maturation protein CgeB